MTAPAESPIARTARAPGIRPSRATPDVWAATLGDRWRWYLALLGALLFLGGALAPLADIDLPMHLATGEWIARHRALPMTEPFAWTRAGAPYYAYSWLAELAYYELLRVAGPFGPRLLHGVVFLAAGASMVWLGRVSRWRPWTTLVMAALNVVLLVGVAPFLRPQGILFATAPAAWALVARARATEERQRLVWGAAVGLAALSALTVNVHLIFLVTGLPLADFVARPPRKWTTAAVLALGVMVGWLCTPYVLVQADVLRLIFAPNALFTQPSWISEFRPGFSLVSRGDPAALVVALLALLPWVLVDDDSTTTRERLVYGALWLVGLVGFGVAARAIVVWWMAMLPMIARVVNRIPQPSSSGLRRGQQAALAAAGVVLVLRLGLPSLALARQEGTVASRRLPSPAAASFEPLAEWLDAHVPRGTGGRVLTAFHYGSYLAWRLPSYSASIDGRTIFPDSAARPEAYHVASAGAPPLGPWRSADLAIVPLRFPVAAVLDTARGWRRVATVDSSARVPLAVGLWVRDAWWHRAGGHAAANAIPASRKPARQAGDRAVEP